MSDDPFFLITVCIIAFAVSWIIIRFLSRIINGIHSVEIVNIDFNSKMGSIYKFSLAQFKGYTVDGCSLPFRWSDGSVFYFARNIDFEKKIIDLGWPHKVSIEEAAVILSALESREEDYTAAKKENILLRRYSKVIGADIARSAADAVFKDLDDAFGTDNFDVNTYLKDIDPVKLFDLSEFPAAEEEIKEESE